MFPSRWCLPFILPLCPSLSPPLWPFPLPSPGVSIPVSVWRLLLWNASRVVAWAVVALVLAAYRSRCLPLWVYPCHPVRGLVFGEREQSGLPEGSLGPCS